MSDKPTTPTGQRMQSSMAYEAREAGAPEGYDDWTADILAIEREAREQERERHASEQVCDCEADCCRSHWTPCPHHEDPDHE